MCFNERIPELFNDKIIKKNIINRSSSYKELNDVPFCIDMDYKVEHSPYCAVGAGRKD